MAKTETQSDPVLKLQYLEEENQRLKERCDALYDAAISSNKRIAEIAATKSMVLHRKAMVKAGKGDFLTMLRPQLGQVEAQHRRPAGFAGGVGVGMVAFWQLRPQGADETEKRCENGENRPETMPDGLRLKSCMRCHKNSSG